MEAIDAESIQTEPDNMEAVDTESISMEPSSPFLTKKEQRLLDGQMEIDWLKRQIEQRKQDLASFAANNEKVAQLGDDQVQEQLKAYLEQIEQTRVQMDIMSQYNLCKERIVTNLDDGHYTLDALYNHLKTQRPGINTEKVLQIQDLVMQRDKLAVQEMQLLEELNNTQNENTLLHTQIIEHHQHNQQLGVTLKTIKEEHEQQYQRPNTDHGSITSSQPTNEYSIEKLHVIQNRLETLKNILMGLILESGVDWASDSKWSRVMLYIGTEEEEV